MKSLCYLRGWTTPNNVREEFDELNAYAKSIDCCVICHKENKSSTKVENVKQTETNDCKHNKMNVIKR